MGAVSRKYDSAAGKYNGICAYLEVILSENERPTSVPKVDEARAAYNTFLEATVSLSGQSLHGDQFAVQALPSLGDIFKGVDIILKGVEWFKERHEKEKLRIVEILKRTEWNDWANAGSAKKSGEPVKEGGKTAKAGENL